MQIIIRIFLMVSFLIILVPLTVNADYYTKYNQNVTAYSASKYKTNGNTRFVASHDKKFVGAKNFGKKTMDLKFITR